MERHFFATSACGVCGKANLRSLLLKRQPRISPGPSLSAEVFYGLAEKMNRDQPLFARTGGLHSAALFSSQGRLLALREDVGRHNAVDKLVGWALTENRLPLGECLVLVSGRAGFEIVQKTLTAGASVLCALSAPSTLAVALARDHGLTLVAFLRDRRFNVYCGRQRIEGVG
jgi:FdhD protein